MFRCRFVLIARNGNRETLELEFDEQQRIYEYARRYLEERPAVMRVVARVGGETVCMLKRGRTVTRRPLGRRRPPGTVH